MHSLYLFRTLPFGPLAVAFIIDEFTIEADLAYADALIKNAPGLVEQHLAIRPPLITVADRAVFIDNHVIDEIAHSQINKIFY